MVALAAVVVTRDGNGAIEKFQPGRARSTERLRDEPGTGAGVTAGDVEMRSATL